MKDKQETTGSVYGPKVYVTTSHHHQNLNGLNTRRNKCNNRRKTLKDHNFSEIINRSKIGYEIVLTERAPQD
ncbi:hypothetical protein HOG17_01955 [Candidatus Peregrinibacteria bacterium]|nr:hypothetical protein [Candidatus Peregrinibacteria bacterium]MBT4148487.1 hypothetical protein [Candidatus Peregrinibacteria bacterium]MBT4456423.1 hypothetical protein [Candidatus Peregrinibacteria bacterium]